MLWPYSPSTVKEAAIHWKTVKKGSNFYKLTADEQRMIVNAYLMSQSIKK